MTTKPFLKEFRDSQEISSHASDLGLRYRNIGVIERQATQRTWVGSFFEETPPVKDELKALFIRDLNLNEEQASTFLERDLFPFEF